jgi:hypothetical protein
MARGKKGGLADGETFVMIRLEVRESRAWRELSDGTRRLLDRLEVEHMRHRGLCNGNLISTYDHFQQWGMRRASIPMAIREATCFGFLEVQQLGYRTAGQYLPANRYRLTYVFSARIKTRAADEKRCAPTDEWKRIKTDTDVAFARAQIAADTAAARRCRRKSNSSGSPARLSVDALALLQERRL